MLLETRRDQWLACLTSKELSLAGDLAYWNYGLNELVTSSSASRTSSRVQLKQLELNHRWSHGHVQLRVDSIHRLLQQQITGDALSNWSHHGRPV